MRTEAEAHAEKQNEDEEASNTRACDDHEEERSDQEVESKKASDNEKESDKEEENDEEDQENEQQGEENGHDDEEEDDEEDECDEKKSGAVDNNEVPGNVFSYSEIVNKALMGDLDGEFPENVKVVRIFTSSTFTGKYILTNEM